MDHNRRKKILVKKKFQVIYVGYIIVFMIFVAVISGGTVFHTLFSILAPKLAGIYPEGRLMAIFTKTALILARNLLILTPFIIVIGILLSHRIAGPISRIERVMEEIGNGNFKMRLAIRRSDELQDMADALNKMTELLDQKDTLEKEAQSIVIKDLADIRAQIEKGSLDKNQILKELAEIEEAVKKFRKT